MERHENAINLALLKNDMEYVDTFHATMSCTSIVKKLDDSATFKKVYNMLTALPFCKEQSIPEMDYIQYLDKLFPLLNLSNSFFCIRHFEIDDVGAVEVLEVRSFGSKEEKVFLIFEEY